MEVGEHTENLDHLQIFPGFCSSSGPCVSLLCLHKNWCSAGMCDSEGPLPSPLFMFRTANMCHFRDCQGHRVRRGCLLVWSFLLRFWPVWQYVICPDLSLSVMLTFPICLELELLPFLTVPVAWAFSAFYSRSSQVCVLEKVLAVMAHSALVRLPNQSWGGGETRRW